MGDQGVRGGRTRFNYLSAVYDLLASKAEKKEAKDLIEFGYPAQEGEELLVYTGHSTKDAQVLGFLDSAVSHALATLKAMNAITRIVIGTKNKPSIYILHYTPTMEHFENFIGRSYAIERKIAPTTYDQLINDIARIRERLVNIERELAELRVHTHDGHNI